MSRNGLTYYKKSKQCNGNILVALMIFDVLMGSPEYGGPFEFAVGPVNYVNYFKKCELFKITQETSITTNVLIT